MTDRVLTFGDTFTLPATGDDIWQIRDRRPDLQHPVVYFKSALASTHKRLATYDPDGGWTVGGAHPDTATIRDQLNALDVHLPHYTGAELTERVMQRIGDETTELTRCMLRDLRTHLGSELIERATGSAHIAATVAAVIAGEPARGPLYDTVFAVTLARLRA